MARVRKNFRIDSMIVDLMEKAVSKGVYKNQTDLVEKALMDLINKELSKEEIRGVMEKSIKREFEVRLADSRPVGSPLGEPVKEKIMELYNNGVSIQKIIANLEEVSSRMVLSFLAHEGHGSMLKCGNCKERTFHVSIKKGAALKNCIKCGEIYKEF